MRILTVSNVPLEAHLGSGYVIGECAERLRAAGHEVTTLDPRDYEILPRLRAAKRLRMLFGYSRATLRAVSARRYDLVEFWGIESWWIAGRLARRPARPLLAGRSNGLEPQFGVHLARHSRAELPGPVGRAFDRWQRGEDAFRRVDGLTVPSRFNARFAAEHGYQPPERLLTLEVPLRDDWLAQPFVAERPRVLGFCGGAVPNKGRDVLASALPDLLRARPEWRASFLGVDPGWPATNFAPDVATRVEAGPFRREPASLRAWFQSVALLAMPSAYESFGIAAAEAMACGCTVVASATGFPGDLQQGVEAIIVQERNAEAWSRALGAIMADEEQRRRIARAGQERVQGLRWTAAIARLLEFYQRLQPRGSKSH